MATQEEEVIIRISADTDDATASTKELKDKLDGINNTVIDKPFKTFKAEIKEATTEAKRMEEQFGKNSSQFADAAKKVAGLKDRFGEFNQSVQSFNPDNKLQALVSVARGATGALQGATGAMAFLGVESSKASETIAKLQGLMAFSDALNSVDDIKNSFKNLGAVIQSSTVFQKANNAVTVLAGSIMKAFGVSVNVTSNSFKFLKGAIAATGIGLLIVLIGEAVQAFQEFSGAADRAAESQKKFDEYNVKNAKDNLDLTENRLKREKGIATAKASTEAEKFAIEQNYLKQSYAAQATYYNKVQNLDADAATDSNKKLDEIKNQGTINAINEKKRLQKIDDDASKEKADKAKQAAESARQKSQQEAEKIKADRQQELDELAEIEKNSIRAISDSKLSERQKELSDLQIDFEEKKNKYKKYGKDVSIITTEYGINRKSIEQKYADELSKVIEDVTLNDYDKQRVAIKDKYDALLKNAKDFAAQIQVEILRAQETSKVDTEQTVKTNTVNAETTLINTEIDNSVKDTDTPEQRVAKLQAVYDADKSFKEAKLQEELASLGNNESEIANVKAKFRQDEIDAEKELADKKKEIDDKTLEAKRANIDLGIGFANAAVDLLGKNTVAGKALAIATATIDTYEAAQGAYKSQMKLATPDAPIRAAVAAGVAVLQGLAKVKAIASVKIPTRNGGSASGGSASAPALSAPQINSTMLQADLTKIQDVRITNPQNQVIKTYISQKDLQDNQDKTEFLKNLGTI